MKQFGSRLREFREMRGLTQEELGRAVNTDWTQISRYERGINAPTADRLVALARVLRVTPNSLLLGDRSAEEKLEFQNIRLYERFLVLDKLPKDEQETALKILDGVIAKYELENLAAKLRKGDLNAAPAP